MELADIYVSNIAANHALQESHFLWLAAGPPRPAGYERGVAPFHDASEDLGLSRSSWSWDSRLADLRTATVTWRPPGGRLHAGNADRWPELQEIATANDRLLRHAGVWPPFRPGDGFSGGPESLLCSCGRRSLPRHRGQLGLGEVQLTRAIATADVDGDGDLDIALANQWNDSRFYRNTATRRNAFLGLHLIHPQDETMAFAVRPGHPDAAVAGWPAIGAQAKIRRSDGQTRVAHVDGGNGHAGRRSPDLYFGLGGAGSAQVSVELKWRSRAGAVHHDKFEIRPGWHTVILGRKGS